VAAKRARQLQGGARPVLPTSSKKPTIIAMEEVRRGLVKYSLTGRRRIRCRSGTRSPLPGFSGRRKPLPMVAAPMRAIKNRPEGTKKAVADPGEEFP
jgi:hypothetical protein